jgi:hypothetical protein
MRYIFLFLLPLLTFTGLSAQQTNAGTTPAAVAGKKILADFPSTRPLTIDYQQSLGRDFSSELNGEGYREGEVDGQQRVSVGLNLPLYYRPKLIVATALNYTYDKLSFDDFNTLNGDEAAAPVGYDYYSAGLNVIHFNELFGKPLTLAGGVILDGGSGGIQRFKGMASGTLTMVDNERTKFSLGLVAIIDPTSQLPFAPIVRYEHQFKNSPYTLDIVLPSRVLIRRHIGTRSRLSIGTTFGGNGYYVNVEQPDFSQDYEYSQLELNTGLIYEYKVSKSVILTARGGLTSFLSNRLTEKGEPNRDFIYRNEQGSTGYFGVGLSWNPFSGK